MRIFGYKIFFYLRISNFLHIGWNLWQIFSFQKWASFYEALLKILIKIQSWIRCKKKFLFSSIILNIILHICDWILCNFTQQYRNFGLNINSHFSSLQQMHYSCRILDENNQTTFSTLQFTNPNCGFL